LGLNGSRGAIVWQTQCIPLMLKSWTSCRGVSDRKQIVYSWDLLVIGSEFGQMDVWIEMAILFSTM
jgi:hypothetical protein